MSSGEKVRVADAFDLQMGKTPSRKNPEYWREGTHNWVSIADLGSFDKYVGKTKECINDLGIKESRIKPAPANTILMSFKLSIGKTAITVDPVYTNEAIMAFVDKGTHPVDVNFMYHQCKSKDWTRGTNTAVMGKTLNKKTLGNALIWLPCPDEQRRIATELDFIDAQIKLAEQQIAQLDQLVKSRFVEMFGDPASSENKWPMARLDSFSQVVTGNTPSRKNPEYYGEGIEWVKTDNITNSVVSKAAEQLTDAGRQKARVAHAGSILMACIAGSVKSIGKVGLLDREAAFNQQINAIIPGEAADSRYLLVLLTLSKDYLCSSINKQLKGILNKSALSAKEFPLPPLALQQDFAAFVTQVDKTRAIAQQQIDKLQTLYDSLAQEYFS